MLPAHPSTHGTHQHSLPHVPSPQAACCPTFSCTSALSCYKPALLSRSSLPCKSRGRAQARQEPASSLFCAEQPLTRGTCISSALSAASLPGDTRGSFELISRKAAGFFSRWQREYLCQLTASPWAGAH